MVFCNLKGKKTIIEKDSHNPYFSRWFSAILISNTIKLIATDVTILILVDGFLQSRKKIIKKLKKLCHNPYFSRWFSAIGLVKVLK